MPNLILNNFEEEGFKSSTEGAQPPLTISSLKVAITQSRANTMQVGGSHYKSPMQHWDYVVANEIPYLEAMVMKYLTRWRKKDGHQDVRKAYHFLIKLAEVEGINLHVEPAAASQEEAAEAGRGYVNQD